MSSNNRHLAAGLVCCVLTAGCSGQPAFRLIASMDELMEASVRPPAEAIWRSVSTTMGLGGTEEKFPKMAEEWEEVERNAIALAEAANLLVVPGRVPEGGNWTSHVDALVDSALEARAAAKQKSPEALFDAGGRIYEVCNACHAEYLHGGTGDRAIERAP